MPERGTCIHCHQPVRQSELAAFRVTGWEVERAQGGANRILDRKREPDIIAHAKCAEHHAKYGAQGALILWG